MISICMTYYNRQEQLNRTIASIQKSAFKDYEIIIVDDASDIPCKCDVAKIIRIERKDKWWHNPCIPFNMAFKEAKGDVVVIQNPECMHYGDVLQYASEHIQPNVYLSFGCYALNEKETAVLRHNPTINIQDKRYGLEGRNGYYNHPALRPVGYHFCSVITKQDLDMLGGFDEAYAKGISFDDDDLVYKINDKGMQLKIIGYPIVVHQWHPPFTYKKEGWQQLHAINKKIFQNKWQ